MKKWLKFLAAPLFCIFFILVFFIKLLDGNALEEAAMIALYVGGIGSIVVGLWLGASDGINWEDDEPVKWGGRKKR